MKKKISTELTDENIAAVLEVLAANPERFQAVAAGLSAAELQRPLGPDERSVTENLAHIVHCEARSTEYIIHALLLKEPLMHRIHPERGLGKLWRLDQYPFPDLLAYFSFRRTVMLHVLQSLNKREWARTAQEPGKKRRESVYWQARGQALHEAGHLADIAARLAGS